MSQHQFDQFKGRIAPHASHSVPQGVTAATVKEPTQIIWAQKPHKPAPGFWDDYPRNRIQKYQAIFQKPDGLPVHLKRGMRDKGIYFTTLGLTAFGTVWACYTLFQMCRKKS